MLEASKIYAGWIHVFTEKGGSTVDALWIEGGSMGKDGRGVSP